MAANPEVAVHQDRQGVIVLRRQVIQWLDGATPQCDLIRSPPARTFVVCEIGVDAVQPTLGF